MDRASWQSYIGHAAFESGPGPALYVAKSETDDEGLAEYAIEDAKRRIAEEQASGEAPS